MNIEDRVSLAALIAAERRRQYGTKAGAYTAAGVNAATWDRIEAGEPVREDRLTAAVLTLWPETGGDWRKVATPSTGDRPLADRTNRELLGEVEWRLERGRETDGATAATTQAAGSAATDELDEIRDRLLKRFQDYVREADLARKDSKDSAAWLARLRADFEAGVAAEFAQVRPERARDVG